MDNADWRYVSPIFSFLTVPIGVGDISTLLGARIDFCSKKSGLKDWRLADFFRSSPTMAILSFPRRKKENNLWLNVKLYKIQSISLSLPILIFLSCPHIFCFSEQFITGLLFFLLHLLCFLFWGKLLRLQTIPAMLKLS